VRRRKFIALLGGAAIVAPIAATAQQPVIGVLVGGTLTSRSAKSIDAFRQGLAETGYVEGRNVAIEFSRAEGHYDRLPALAAELVSRRVTVIAAMSEPAAVAAKAATATIPIVFYGGSDPVAAGFITSLAHPGGNMTGVTRLVTELNPKRMEILRQLVPNAGAFGLLVNPKNPNAARQARDTVEAARTLGLRIVVANASAEDEFAAAVASLAGKADALIVAGDPLFGNRSESIAALTLQHRLPAIYNDRYFAEAGGLVSYGDSIVNAWRQVAIHTGKILAGAKPADLPVQQPTRFELVNNLTTAKALGLTVPPALLAGADEVIE
jgi:putative ABC transport system substrate-binding protein